MNQNPIRVSVIDETFGKFSIARSGFGDVPYVVIELFKDEVPDLVAELRRLAPNKIPNDTASQLYDAEQELSSSNKKLKELEKKLEDAGRKYDKLREEANEEIDRYKQRAINLGTQVTELERELKATKNNLQEECDRRGAVERDLARALGYIDHVNEMADPTHPDHKGRFRGPKVSGSFVRYDNDSDGFRGFR